MTITKTELFMNPEQIDCSGFRYYYHTDSLHTYEDELPVLLQLGGKHIVEIEGQVMTFEAEKYDLVEVNNTTMISVICFQVENEIDMKSLLRQLKINNVLDEQKNK